MMPIHLFGIAENFQCVPIILSILYGKRRSGWVAVGLLAGYNLLLVHQPLVIPAIAIYSAIPMILCNRFEHYDRSKRWQIALGLVFLTLALEWAFLVGVFALTVGLARFQPYLKMLIVASGIQSLLMACAFWLLESIRDNGVSRKRVESLIQYNPLGIAVVDTATRYVRVNPAYEAMTGYTAAELIGLPWRALADPESYDDETIKRVQQGSVLHAMPYTIRHKKGYPVPVRYTLVPIIEGEVTGYFSLLVDRTEMEQAEETLIRQEQLSQLGRLAAGIVHDVRSPLTAIMGLVELLPTVPDPQEPLQIIGDELHRIHLLLSELLALGKPASKVRIPRDLKAKLHDILRLLAKEADRNGVALSTRMVDDPVMVVCDPNQLKQALINIVKNAIEASEPGGRVRVSLGFEHGQVSIRVEDRGQGMPPELIQRIGEPFLTTKTAGTGLGLMMTQRIVESHGGHLEVRSTPGHGTVVSILLPYASAEAEDTAVDPYLAEPIGFRQT